MSFTSVPGLHPSFSAAASLCTAHVICDAHTHRIYLLGTIMPVHKCCMCLIVFPHIYLTFYVILTFFSECVHVFRMHLNHG